MNFAKMTKDEIFLLISDRLHEACKEAAPHGEYGVRIQQQHGIIKEYTLIQKPMFQFHSIDDHLHSAEFPKPKLQEGLANTILKLIECEERKISDDAIFGLILLFHAGEIRRYTPFRERVFSSGIGEHRDIVELASFYFAQNPYITPEGVTLNGLSSR